MKKLRFKIEDYARSLIWYLDYGFFRLTHPFLKSIPKDVKSILIIDLKFIGDLIIDTPTIRALKQHYPYAKISILVPKEMKEVLYNNPNLYKIYTDITEINGHFDLGILLYPGNKFISSFLRKRASYRIGIRKSGFTEPKGYYLHRKTFPTFKIKHKIEDNLDVIKTLNISSSDNHLELYLKNPKTNYKDYIVISPISKTHPTWSKKNFAELADSLSKKYNKKIIFTGSEENIPFIEDIQKNMKGDSINLAGKTSLQEFFSLIKNAYFVFCIDTSAQHVAAALNIPVVALFSAGDKRIWSPYSKNSIAIQNSEVCIACMKSKCPLSEENYLECVKSIIVEKVLEEISKLNLPNS
ncbi:MAG: glycosyltransferase family 9 protein [Nanoarchaeota archaeon]|nr:glycosyltransferase family 9 protein [Nanoarchaeota archaeon]